MLESREQEWEKGNWQKGKHNPGLKTAIKIKLNPHTHTQNALCLQLKLPEHFTLELRAKGFSEKTNHTNNRPYCFLEGAYLRQNKASHHSCERSLSPLLPQRPVRLWETNDLRGTAVCVTAKEKRSEGAGGRKGGCWLAEPSRRSPSSNDIPPGTAGRRLQAPGVSIQPVTGLGSHSPEAKHLSGRPAASPGQCGL